MITMLVSATPVRAAGAFKITALSDDAPTGFRLENMIPTDGPYVVTVLECTVEVGDEFDPDWMVDGRCTREQLDGAIVLLTADDPS